jgi:pectate lyase
MKHVRDTVRPCACACALSLASCPATDGAEATPRLKAVRTFADNVLNKGRDRWSGKETPLLADGIDIETGAPVVWKHKGRESIIHNLASQQNLFRVLTALTNLTGDARYKNAAQAAIRYHFKHLVSDCGLLRWGGHQFIDLRTLTPVGDFDINQHELKWNLPYYELMWETDPQATATCLRAIWRGHILDWRTLALSRHAPYRTGSPPSPRLWEQAFAKPEPFFESVGLSFLNCGSDLIHAGALLYRLGGEKPALTWARRLSDLYTRARHPKTGMGGFQFTKAKRRQQPPAKGPLTDRLTYSMYGDRMENQYAQSGSADPADEFYNPIKGKIAEDGLPVAREGWQWFDSKGFPDYALLQLYLAEAMGAEACGFAEDAADHLEAHARHAYDAATNHFRPMWADGTDLSGLTIPRTGYYGSQGQPYRAFPATSQHVAAYARAYRLTRRDGLWDTARAMARGLGLGDIGRTPGHDVALAMDTAHSDPVLLFALIEMHRAGATPAYLQLAERIADNMLEQRFHQGFFVPDKSRLNANFDAIEPLALLALEAVLQGRPAAVPAYVGGCGYIQGSFDGYGRTYDRVAIWGQTR